MGTATMALCGKDPEPKVTEVIGVTSAALPSTICPGTASGVTCTPMAAFPATLGVSTPRVVAETGKGFALWSGYPTDLAVHTGATDPVTAATRPKEYT